MKKLLIIIALFSFVSLGAEAQQQRESQSPEKIAERITEKMSKELELSEAQKKEIYVLNLENTQTRREEMQLMREKFKAEREANQEKLNAILTPEQKEIWEARKREFRGKRMSPGEGRGKSEKRGAKHRRPANSNK